MIVTESTAPSVRLSGEGWRLRWALGIAEAVSVAADCTRRRVGAVLLDPASSWAILGQGYNGLVGPGGCMTTGACPRGRFTTADLPGLVTPYDSGRGHCEALHGEANALTAALRGGHSPAGAVMAVTDEPCPGCRELLTAHGVGLVVWPGGSWTPSDTIHENAQVERPATREGGG